LAVGNKKLSYRKQITSAAHIHRGHL